MRTLLLSTAFIAIASTALATAAVAAPQGVRGTIVSAAEDTLTVHTDDGQTVTVGLSPKTRYGASSASTLAAVQSGEFIGTATKDENGKQVALEVLIFPNSMRGTGEGSYPWDEISDTTTSGAPVASHMTNGNVQSAMPAKHTASTMTNGNIQAATAQDGNKTLVVTYKGGQQTIDVPPTAPVVKVAPATYAALKPGESAFIVALPGAAGLTAAYVNVGLGGIKLAM
jgi:ABC-type Fe3+-hydroxamate transport system substrate-binding protein